MSTLNMFFMENWRKLSQNYHQIHVLLKHSYWFQIITVNKIQCLPHCNLIHVTCTILLPSKLLNKSTVKCTNPSKEPAASVKVQRIINTLSANSHETLLECQ